MTSKADLESKLEEILTSLRKRGTNAEMKEWYTEYLKLKEELKEATAAETTAPGLEEKTDEVAADEASSAEAKPKEG